MVNSLGKHYIELKDKFMRSLTPKEKEIIDKYAELSREVMSSPIGSEKSKTLYEKQKAMFKKYDVIRRKNDLRWQ